MTLEEILVDGDVLDGDDPPAWIVIDDGVHEKRGIPVAQPVDEDRNVDGHGAQRLALLEQGLRIIHPRSRNAASKLVLRDR
jgi:hypothetical protein